MSKRGSNTSCFLTLSDSREEEYDLYASVLEYVMTDKTAYNYYGREYPQLLAELLETDAEIAASLYQIVCVPHLKGKYADHSVTAVSYENLFSSVPGQNKHLNGRGEKEEEEKQTRTILSALTTRPTRLSRRCSDSCRTPSVPRRRKTSGRGKMKL